MFCVVEGSRMVEELSVDVYAKAVVQQNNC